MGLQVSSTSGSIALYCHSDKQHIAYYKMISACYKTINWEDETGRVAAVGVESADDAGEGNCFGRLDVCRIESVAPPGGEPCKQMVSGLSSESLIFCFCVCVGLFCLYF